MAITALGTMTIRIMASVIHTEVGTLGTGVTTIRGIWDITILGITVTAVAGMTLGGTAITVGDTLTTITVTQDLTSDTTTLEDTRVRLTTGVVHTAAALEAEALSITDNPVMSILHVRSAI